MTDFSFLCFFFFFLLTVGSGCPPGRVLLLYLFLDVPILLILLMFVMLRDGICVRA